MKISRKLCQIFEAYHAHTHWIAALDRLWNVGCVLCETFQIKLSQQIVQRVSSSSHNILYKRPNTYSILVENKYETNVHFGCNIFGGSINSPESKVASSIIYFIFRLIQLWNINHALFGTSLEHFEPKFVISLSFTSSHLFSPIDNEKKCACAIRAPKQNKLRTKYEFIVTIKILRS